MNNFRMHIWHVRPSRAHRSFAGQDLRGQQTQRPALDCSLAEVQRMSDEEAAHESRLMLLTTGAGKLVRFKAACL